MKKMFLLTATLLVCNACAVGSISTQSADGKITNCSGYYASMFKDIEASSLSACGAKGKSEGSKANAEALQEILKAVIAVP